MMSYEWLTTEALYVTPNGPTTEDGVVVVSEDRKRAVALTVDESGTEVLVNGEYHDFGDDFPVILGLIDEAIELGTGEHCLGAVER